MVQTKTETFQDVINFPPTLSSQLAFLFGAVDEADPPVTEGARTRWQSLEAEWQERKTALQEFLDDRVAAFNALVEEHQVPAVVVPPAGKHLEEDDEE